MGDETVEDGGSESKEDSLFCCMTWMEELTPDGTSGHWHVEMVLWTPATFQRLMEKVMAGTVKDPYFVLYDVLVV